MREKRCIFSNTAPIHAIIRLTIKGDPTPLTACFLREGKEKMAHPSPLPGALSDSSAQATALLKAGDKLYRDMFELHRLPKLIIDPVDTRILDANIGAARFYGMDIETLKQHTLIDLSLSAPDFVLEKLNRAANAQMLSVMSVQRGAGNSPRHVELFTGPLEIEGKKLVFAIVTDITEKYQAQAALEEINRSLEQRVADRTAELARVHDRLQAIFNHSGDAILLLDVEKGIQQANAAFVALLGISPAAWVGKTLQSFCDPPDAARISATIRRVQSAYDTCRLEARLCCEGGTSCEVEMSFSPVSADPHTVTGLVCIIRDITERKRAEGVLKESEQRFRQFIESAPVPTIISDSGGTIVLVNKEAEKVFGYRRAELEGLSVEALVPEAHRPPHVVHRHRFFAARETRRMGRSEVLARRQDGSTFPADIELSYIDTRPAPLVMSFIIDVTQRQQAEEALRQALAHEKELNDLKSRFVSMASHEFRTPLAAIHATAETLTIYRDKMNAAQVDERLEKIRRQVNHMQGIVEDVLQLARIQAGRVEFRPTEGDLAALCRQIFEEFESHPANRGRLPEAGLTTPLIAFFDAQLMRQALSNVIGNALKYTPDGTPVHVALLAGAGQILFEVEDHGIGIPAADLKHLFEPFHRAANVGTISGTGLGLSIAKQAVEMHGGRLSVESEVGRGTTVTLVIPLRTGADPLYA